MNKNIAYILLAVAGGILVGWLIFGNNNAASKNAADQHDHAGETAAQLWTCSMHPQIMQPEPGDCPLCGMDLIPAESGADGLALNEIKMTENAMALANIQTTVVGSEVASNDADGMLSLSGKIAINEENKSVQSSYFDGRIERLNVSYEGQQVNRGQLLATIYAPNLVAAQQELITTASIKASQPALYQAVRNKLKNWKLSEKQIDAIETSGKVLENFPIYATVSGTVSEVMAREGDYVKQGQPILKVSNLNSVWAQFDAYESQISNLKEGQKIKVVANAYPNKEFDATVSFIDPMLNNATRTVTVRATLKNTDDLFKPGMFVTGKIKGATTASSEMLTVPASAVMWTGERSLVYVKTDPNAPVFEMREVTIGNRNGSQYTITKGLNNGDEIVTNGTFTVDAAAQLQGKNSMMNKGKEKQAQVPLSEMKIELSEKFQKEFMKILNPYLQMKDAFVASDAKQVSVHAKTTLKALKSLKLEDLGQIEKAHMIKSIEMVEVISKNDDLDNQREHFVILNENIVPIAMNVKILDAALYVQKCPMANNDKGAIWLSKEETVRNPYYGDQMMTCGSVIETVK
ncbi:Cu(I)/Ag(I) efflux system membrane fusion protein [Gelidibacter sediminis]|uniref:Cu(I)/Ag(I) efflux system membrane fusion protein n=1 Tax=Gelidibacter sediminis TaxID=1608710 RepID=A0A4R7PL54_9FLAO|nr:efflux RND transporter periplasmic adaptor subunit [Gelidibacter sediminis]TDU34290.1 Cu(I)/Ag(I) efflux system membrane fusion protein [Gelidibacter sediminis]